MYSKMAFVYDALMYDAPYDKWINFFKHHVTHNSNLKILDVGCGTGELSIRLAEDGYCIKAFDLSEEMIEVANQKAEHISNHVDFFQANAIDFNLNESFDVIISFCDVLNYITDESDLIKALNQIFQHLNDGGLFIFDVHSLAYIRELDKHQIFSEVYDDLAYVWFSNEKQLGEIHHDLTFFIKNEQEQYDRFDEYHIQKTYPKNTYVQMLKSIGFKEINVYHDFSLNEDFNEDDVKRLFFVCKK